jgi:hypothetical protein
MRCTRILNSLRTVLASAAPYAFLALMAYGSASAQARKIELGDLAKIVTVSDPQIAPDGKGEACVKLYALFLVGFAGYAVSAFGHTESEIRERIVGTWKLVSMEETMKNGTTRPFPSFGPHAKGFLMYQREGYMCAEIVNPERPQWVAPAHARPKEKLAAADGTFAYCGRYEIDVKQERIVHLPEVATDPGYVGSRQIRPYRFESGRLILSDVERDDPSVARWTIVWEKVQ